MLVGEIAKASFRLNQQVENLLNMSRLESGFLQPRKDWCDINEITYQAVRRVEENIVPQQIVVRVSESLPVCRLDKGMVDQIIYNLLNNAVLYSPPDATIHIDGSCKGGILKLIIGDTGPGFPENEIESVFDKFYRLKNSRTGGTGLGLSIVKGFTEALGGKITVRNANGGGAIFTISIPVEISLVEQLDNE